MLTFGHWKVVFSLFIILHRAFFSFYVPHALSISQEENGPIVAVFLRPRGGIATTCLYRVIKIVDQAIKSIVGEDMMERLLICPKSLSYDRKRYFGTSEGTLGVNFEILNDMDQCVTLIPEEGSLPMSHSIKDTHQIMLTKVIKRSFSIDHFLEGGIDQIEKVTFNELLGWRPGLDLPE